MPRLSVALARMAPGVLGLLAACDSHPREAKTPDPPLDDGEAYVLREPSFSRRCYLYEEEPAAPAECARSPRYVKVWGPAPIERAPDPRCPTKVRLDERGGLIAEPYVAFDPMPEDECVPPKFQVGQRRVFRVEDGVIVAYAGAFDGEVFWEDPDTFDRARVSSARLVGFARAPSGTVLALGVGRARLGLGGVLALERRGRGQYQPRLVATLPVQPSAVAFDDHGRLLTFAQGFVVRIDEHGRVENLHYLSRDLGRITSIARNDEDVIFLGLECGVLRLVPRPEGMEGPKFSEEWWSARDGASGRWSACQ